MRLSLRDASPAIVSQETNLIKQFSQLLQSSIVNKEDHMGKLIVELD